MMLVYYYLVSIITLAYSLLDAFTHSLLLHVLNIVHFLVDASCQQGEPQRSRHRLEIINVKCLQNYFLEEPTQ